jgi:hypothetical protein
MKQKFSVFIGISALSLLTFLAIARNTPGSKPGGYDQSASLPHNARVTEKPSLPERNPMNTDLAITARICGELADRKILSANTSSVQIATTGGRVVLMGEVVTTEQKRLIGDVAIRIQLRENVDNHLVVKPSPSAPSAPTGLRVVQ